ncbi:hypothetical protein BC351_19695 [Paenibacillus ferrarius]|uniref:Uncharacterized protein n=1 Tax=Paenibacillus ferrarius TaxID=1469647 RepID=A0A1V4HP13_9BACL|nr:hypothetical protein BC351_19695 [Paenibacillus ferrarius]
MYVWVAEMQSKTRREVRGMELEGRVQHRRARESMKSAARAMCKAVNYWRMEIPRILLAPKLKRNYDTLFPRKMAN